MNNNMHSPFFIVTNFEIWVYKEIKIHFLLETLGLAQMTLFHTTVNTLNNLFAGQCSIVRNSSELPVTFTEKTLESLNQ